MNPNEQELSKAMDSFDSSSLSKLKREQVEENSKVHWVSLFAEPAPYDEDATHTGVFGLGHTFYRVDSVSAGETPYVLSEGVLKVGRARGNNIVLDDAAASRLHFSLQVQNDQIELVDQNSSNGTWVNGTRIRQATLRDNDRVSIGGTTEFVLRMKRTPTLTRTSASVRQVTFLRDSDDAKTEVGLPLRPESQDLFEDKDAEPTSLFARDVQESLVGAPTSEKRVVVTKRGNWRRGAFLLGLLLAVSALAFSVLTLVRQLAEHRRQLAEGAYYEALLRATRVAALGNQSYAQALAAQASAFVKDSQMPKVELERGRTFLEVIDALHASDILASIGSWSDAIAKLDGIHLDRLSPEERQLAAKAIASREKYWIPLARAKEEQSKIAAESVEQKLGNWDQVVAFFKGGKLAQACSTAKAIGGSEQVDAAEVKKSQAFLKSKCD